MPSLCTHPLNRPLVCSAAWGNNLLVFHLHLHLQTKLPPGFLCNTSAVYGPSPVWVLPQASHIFYCWSRACRQVLLCPHIVKSYLQPRYELEFQIYDLLIHSHRYLTAVYDTDYLALKMIFFSFWIHYKRAFYSETPAGLKGSNLLLFTNTALRWIYSVMWKLTNLEYFIRLTTLPSLSDFWILSFSVVVLV